MIFDSHAHYDDESFDKDRYELIEKLHNEENIVGIMNCGASLEGMRDSVKLACKYDFIYAAVGIHPEEADEFNEDVIDEIREFSKSSKVKAIGEIGLDYYWEENPPREKQKEIFIRQMELARELKLPVIIHSRDAQEDTLDILKMFPEVKGVVHCFSGSVETARECVEIGYYIGITGVITFKNAKKVKEVVKAIPIDRLLVETDCPYMAPVPHRGTRNQSSYIKHIIDEISEIKGISQEEIEEITINNTKELFNIC